MVDLVPGSCSVGGFGNCVSGLRPPSSAAAVTTTFIVDPGGSRSPWIVRLMSGEFGSASSCW